MAKIRMIKTEVRTSEKVASWPLEVRYFWILLWGYVDDHGKGKDNPLLIKADCFPLDEDITSETIDRWLCVLADAGVIVRYEVAGTRYLAVKNWSEHQKPQHPGKDIYPNYDAQNATILEFEAECMQPSCNIHATCTPELSRVEMSRDEMFNNVEPVKSSYPEHFETWWNYYPRKQGKGAALQAWEKAITKDDVGAIAAGALNYSKWRDLPTDPKFIPLPATWLNQERWNDILPSAPVEPEKHRFTDYVD